MKREKNSSMEKALEIIKAFAVPAIMYLLLTFIMPDKISLSNVKFVLIQAITPAILAWGASFNLTAGHSDFSIGAAMLFASIMGGNIAQQLHLGVWGLLLFCPLFGMLSSGLTGSLFVILKIPSMIVSVGVMLIVESLCSLAFGGGGVNLSLDWIVFGPSNKTLILGLAIFALAYYLYNYRVFGFHVRALGSNAGVAAQCGLNIDKTRLKCFLCVGFFAGLYAAVTLGTTGVAKPVSAMGTMRTAFDAMMCFMVGTALASKVNTIIAIYVGALYMQLVNLVLSAINFPSVFTQTVVAFFVLVVMCYSSIKEAKALQHARRQEFEMAEAREALQ